MMSLVDLLRLNMTMTMIEGLTLKTESLKGNSDL